MKTYTHLIWLGFLLICNSTFAQLCTANFSSIINGSNVLITNESTSAIAHPYYIITSDADTTYKDETFDTISFHYEPGDHLITLTMYSIDSAETDCTSIYLDTVTIEQPFICEAKFAVSINGFDVLVTNQSETSVLHPNYIISSNGTTLYRDEFFDTVSFHYDLPGSYAIAMEMYNADSADVACTDTYADTVAIVCKAKILDKYPAFFDNSDGSTATTAYFWDFGDGTTSALKNPIHAYVAAGTYTVSLAISDSTTGCSDTTYLERYFYPTACKGALFYQQDSDVIYFSPKFIPLIFVPSSIAWNYGDGTTGSVPYHQYDSAGTYFVCCVATDTNLNCTTSNICKWVTVICNVGCTPEFASSNNCGFVSFQNGIIYTTPTTSYRWNFGDGTTGEGRNIQHDYRTETGIIVTYNACLELWDGTACPKSVCHDVEASCETTGIKTVTKSDPEISNLQLYPVPFSDELHLNYTVNINTPLTITVYDCLGQKMMEQTLQNQVAGEKAITLNSSELAKGLYILKMTTHNGQLTKQLIKQ